MKKVLFFDVETTGTDPVNNDIIQFAAIMEIDGKNAGEINIKFQPTSYDNISPKALEVNKTTLEELKTFMPAKDGYLEIISFLGKHIDKFDRGDKFYPGGYNVGFDLNFISEFFKKNNNKYFGSYCNWRDLDPFSILKIMDFKDEINLPNLKLETVCNHYGIPIDAHDAMSDIEATRTLFNLLINLED